MGEHFQRETLKKLVAETIGSPVDFPIPVIVNACGLVNMLQNNGSFIDPQHVEGDNCRSSECMNG